MEAKIIPIDIFNRGVLVFVGSKEQLKEYLSQIDEKVADDIERLDLSAGVAMTLKLPDDAIIYAENKPTIPVMLHEVVHTAMHILDIVGMRITDDTEELFAYLVEFLSKQILTSFYELPCESQ